MSAKAVIRMPGEGKEVTLAGKPLVFLVTGQDTKQLRFSCPRMVFPPSRALPALPVITSYGIPPIAQE